MGTRHGGFKLCRAARAASFIWPTRRIQIKRSRTRIANSLEPIGLLALKKFSVSVFETVPFHQLSGVVCTRSVPRISPSQLLELDRGGWRPWENENNAGRAAMFGFSLMTKHSWKMRVLQSDSLAILKTRATTGMLQAINAF